MSEEEKLTVEQLIEAAQILYGSKRWQADLSDLLGFRDSARLRAILRGDRPVPCGASCIIAAELESRKNKIIKKLDEIEKLS